MKRDSKSAIIRKSGILFAALIFLSACGNMGLPTWMTGEADEAILRAPRVVSGPQAQGERAWPNLADVPESKPSYLKQEKAEGLTRRLVQDQKEAESEAARINQTDMGAVHLANDPVVALEGQTHPVGLLTAPDQPEPAPPKPFSALRP